MLDNKAVARKLWAKTDKRIPGYHPVLNHLIDVANVAGLMWKESLSDAARSAIEADIELSDQNSREFVALLAGLHDLGKASPAFQRLRPELTVELANAGLALGSGESKPHGTITARELKTVLIGGKAGVTSMPMVAGILAQIAGAHHGVIAQSYDIGRLACDSLGDINWADARTELAALLWLLINGGERRSVDLGAEELTNPATVLLLAGLTSVADWIGSNIDYFPFDSHTNPNLYFDHSCAQARSALLQIGWLPAPQYAKPSLFEEVFPFAPNEMQKRVAELVAEQSGAFMLVIEAQMGQGKTEAALYATDNSLCRGLSRGLYIALPTQATSNAMHGRVRTDYLKNRGHSGVEDNLQLVHGNAFLDSVMRVSGIGDKTDDREGAVSAMSWFTARKRPLLAPFGVGTIDQALLGVLQTCHWFVRLFGLANKVVVFDEVHAYDTYTSTLLDRLVEWLSALDCTVILLSATLPQKRLSELVQAYSGRPIVEFADYPRITLTNHSETMCVPVKIKPAPKSVLLEFASDEPSQIVSRVAERLSDGGCAAVICNTVDRAQKVYEALQGEMRDCECILFHARTPFAWRQETEDEVLRKFGKPNKQGHSPDRPPRAVVVATQVIEQSLDLDFDWLLTDMAPIDLILQRLGREHRHKRSQRPVPVSSPILTILSDGVLGGAPPKFDNAGIYERYLVLRSWLAISNESDIVLPDDIDPLVQWVYGGDEPTDVSPEWREALNTSNRDCGYRQSEDSKKAKNLLVPKPGYPEDIMAQFSKQLGEDDDPAVHESVKAATRDGKPSIRFACLVRRDDKLFPVCGTSQINLALAPSEQMTKELLASTVSVQTTGLYHMLRKQSPPDGWKTSPHLRYHRAVEFTDGTASLGSYCLRLTRDLGLVIRKGKS